jgi:hypothetical protein
MRDRLHWTMTDLYEFRRLDNGRLPAATSGACVLHFIDTLYSTDAR